MASDTAATSAVSLTSARPWTKAQRAGIETVGCNILVSAAAGSGKTTVLAERCAHLICDAEPRCGIDELLVVTFTENAAAEMKSRIGNALRQRHTLRPEDGHVVRQLAMLDSAAVGTLHGFCARLLRQHFHLLGLDPEFSILDADEAGLLKREVARDLMEARFDGDEPEAFTKLVDAYGEGDDERIVSLVLRVFDMLASVVDPQQWTDRAVARLQEAAEKPLSESELGRAYLTDVTRDLHALRRSCTEAEKAVAEIGGFEPYVDRLREMYTVVHHWCKTLASDGLSALAEVAREVEFPDLPRMSSKLPGKGQAAARIREVRDGMQDGEWRTCLLFTEEHWQDGIRRTLPFTQTLMELVEQFRQRYDAAKADTGSLDFADLERFALKVLCDPDRPGLRPSAVARQYQAAFAHVLVDEFQDINEVQQAILSLVSRCADKQRSNLFCVGDVKQSIYRFRLADPALFLKLQLAYASDDRAGRLIHLQENFRSREPLLEAINGVFQKLMSQEAAELTYDDSHALIAGATFPVAAGGGFHGAPLELQVISREATSEGATTSDTQKSETGESAESVVELDRTRREATLVAKRIVELVGLDGTSASTVVEGTGPTARARPIRFGDVVILLRSMRYKADEFVAVLRDAGIPVHSESTTGYFEATEINDVLSLLAVLDNAQQDIPLAAVLRSPLVSLPDAETCLARIRLAHPGGSFHEAATAFAATGANPLAAKLRDVFARLGQWRRLVRQRPVAEALWSIYTESGYLAFCSGLPGGEQRTANLIELHERAAQFDSFHRQGLSRFLDFLQKLRDDSDLGQASIASEAENVVRVMSIHRAKGLEFPVVVLPDLGKAINFLDAQGTVLADRREGLGMQVVDVARKIRYPSLAWSVVQRRLRAQTSAEELRVLYVAMTRAKEHLILIGTASAKQLDRWPERWAGHVGAFPAEVVLGGRSMLDWIGPAAAAMGASHTTLTVHSHESLASWSAAHVGASNVKQLDPALVNLEPLKEQPPASEEADAVIARVGARYPFQRISQSPATTSVTRLVHGSNDSVANATALTLPAQALAADTLLPRLSLAGEAQPVSAVDRGNATHAVLEHLDFSRASSRAAIAAQVRQLVDTRRLTSVQETLVDVDALEWLMQHEVGQLLAERSDHLLREVPIYFSDESDPSSSLEAMDRAMVRGRLDLLVPVDDGYLIVDYKTDQVRGEALERRVDEYGPQLRLYRAAIQKITGKRVRRTVLVFLSARVCVDVD